MLPGNANNVPIPNKLRMTDVTNAALTPYPGPKITAIITFIMCCTGKHLEVPTGIDSGDKATVIPISIAVTTIFFWFNFRVSLKFFPSILSSL